MSYPCFNIDILCRTSKHDKIEVILESQVC